MEKGLYSISDIGNLILKKDFKVGEYYYVLRNDKGWQGMENEIELKVVSFTKDELIVQFTGYYSIKRKKISKDYKRNFLTWPKKYYHYLKKKPTYFK